MSRRLDAIDVARGVALVAMAAYHFTWDLAFYGVIERSTPFTPPMRLASHAIGAAFLALAGLSLALAHRHGFHRRAFLVRLVRIGAAAALVTAASYFIAPTAAIGFGVLHCIGVASLLAAPFLLRPGLASALAALAGGIALVAAPSLWSSPSFNQSWLVWLGLGTEPPSTLDWRPLTPWGGILWIGLGLGLILHDPLTRRGRAGAPALRGAAERGRARPLAFAGRHSLAVYLTHQPILIGLLWSGLFLTGADQRIAAEAYVKVCRPACVEAGGEIAACQRACACVVRDAKTAGLVSRLSGSPIGEAERQRLGAIVDGCGADPDR